VGILKNSRRPGGAWMPRYFSRSPSIVTSRTLPIATGPERPVSIAVQSGWAGRARINS